MQLTNDIFTASPASIRADGAHLFWAEKPSESLANSIAEFGQTTPILVCETENGLSLVAGHARLAALAGSEQPVLARMVVDVNAADKGRLYLADNAHRSMDDGMRLKAVEFFAPLMDGATLRENILPRLGVKPRSKDAAFLLAWLGMDDDWRALLACGNVPLAAVAPLARLSAEDRAAVKPLFTNLSWSRSNGVNVPTWLHETGKMTNAPMHEVMRDAGMTDILSQGLSPKDAIARLSTAARQARYPELTRLRDQFTSISEEITAGTRWRMSQPNNFETGGSELTVQVKDAEQLARAVRELDDRAASPAWEKIWRLGSQND